MSSQTASWWGQNKNHCPPHQTGTPTLNSCHEQFLTPMLQHLFKASRHHLCDPRWRNRLERQRYWFILTELQLIGTLQNRPLANHIMACYISRTTNSSLKTFVFSGQADEVSTAIVYPVVTQFLNIFSLTRYSHTLKENNWSYHFIDSSEHPVWCRSATSHWLTTYITFQRCKVHSAQQHSKKFGISAQQLGSWL